MKRINATLIGVLFFTVICAAQETFRFKRNIYGVQREAWHSITLPADIFGHLNRDFSDIRIFTLEGNDTLEIPYVLDVKENVQTTRNVRLPVMNKSASDGVLYLMFELKDGQAVNYLDLNFAERNYFGRVSLQGSDDRLKWFDIITDQRIVSVEKSSGDDYRLSRIDFPLTDYRFLRVRVEADVPLTFQSVSFRHNQVREGSFRDRPLTWSSREDERTDQTIVDIRLQDYGPVSLIEVQADSTGDYYRALRIEFVADSFKTDKGWMKSYETLYEGHLTSFRPNAFTFPWKLARELRMILMNFDDRPIRIQDVSVAGPEVTVLTKLKPGNNFLLYNRQGLLPPSYDLAYFQSSIPDSLATAQLGSAEQLIIPDEGGDALFQSEVWLWAVMAVMIGVLGFFTLKMMSR